MSTTIDAAAEKTAWEKTEQGYERTMSGVTYLAHRKPNRAGWWEIEPGGSLSNASGHRTLDEAQRHAEHLAGLPERPPKLLPRTPPWERMKAGHHECRWAGVTYTASKYDGGWCLEADDGREPLRGLDSFATAKEQTATWIEQQPEGEIGEDFETKMNDPVWRIEALFTRAQEVGQLESFVIERKNKKAALDQLDTVISIANALKERVVNG